MNTTSTCRWRFKASAKVRKRIYKDPQLFIPFLNAFVKIAINPLGGPEIKPIKGSKDLYRVKVNGRVRLIYEVVDNRTVYLSKFGHRDGIYP